MEGDVALEVVDEVIEVEVHSVVNDGDTGGVLNDVRLLLSV